MRGKISLKCVLKSFIMMAPINCFYVETIDLFLISHC